MIKKKGACDSPDAENNAPGYKDGKNSAGKGINFDDFKFPYEVETQKDKKPEHGIKKRGISVFSRYSEINEGK
jgi:hypothetical protein